jgi:hypothetical protein
VRHRARMVGRVVPLRSRSDLAASPRSRSYLTFRFIPTGDAARPRGGFLTVEPREPREARRLPRGSLSSLAGSTRGSAEPAPDYSKRDGPQTGPSRGYPHLPHGAVDETVSEAACAALSRLCELDYFLPGSAAESRDARRTSVQAVQDTCAPTWHRGAVSPSLDRGPHEAPRPTPHTPGRHEPPCEPTRPTTPGAP